MKVFLSWSGNSKPVAEALYDWLPDVLHQLDPWFSPNDIAMGAQSMASLEEALSSTQFGIICLTPQNAESTWLHYEAGALTKGLSNSRVVPFLFRMRPTELRGPLANAQASKTTKSDVMALIESLNSGLGETRLPKDRLRKQFDRWWPDLESRLLTIEEQMSREGEGGPTTPPIEAVLDGLFTTTQLIRERVEETQQAISSLDPQTLIELITGVSLAQTPSRGSVARLADRSNFPPLERQLNNADELLVVGKSLDFFTRENAAVLERFLYRGGQIRCALMDANDEMLIAIASRSLHLNPEQTSLGLDIVNSLERLAKLQANTRQVVGAKVDVRLINYVPPFSLTIFQRTVEPSSVIVELYPFRVTADRRPHIYIEDSMGLFGFFVQQFESVWQSGRVLARFEGEPNHD